MERSWPVRLGFVIATLAPGCLDSGTPFSQATEAPSPFVFSISGKNYPNLEEATTIPVSFQGSGYGQAEIMANAKMRISLTFFLEDSTVVTNEKLDTNYYDGQRYTFVCLMREGDRAFSTSANNWIGIWGIEDIPRAAVMNYPNLGRLFLDLEAGETALLIVANSVADVSLLLQIHGPTFYDRMRGLDWQLTKPSDFSVLIPTPTESWRVNQTGARIAHERLWRAEKVLNHSMAFAQGWSSWETQTIRLGTREESLYIADMKSGSGTSRNSTVEPVLDVASNPSGFDFGGRVGKRWSFEITAPGRYEFVRRVVHNEVGLEPIPWEGTYFLTIPLVKATHPV